jgi:hypothetical protein
LVVAVLGIAAFLTSTNSVHAERYALIYSGGNNINSNFSFYNLETSRFWDLLVNKWGYDVDKVYVLFADGTEPDLDGVDYIKYTGLVNSDWSAVVKAGGHIGTATKGDFIETLQTIGDRMEPGRDSFFFWSFDHGGQTSPALSGNGSLISWYSGEIFSREFGDFLRPIRARNPVWEAYVMNQCYAEDFANGLGITANDTHRFVTWSSQWHETSTGYSFPLAWAKGMEAGLTTTHALGNYAIEHDANGPNGNGFQHPGWVGGNFSMIDGSPVPSMATKVQPATDTYFYSTDDSGLTITGYSGPGVDVVIPGEIEGAPVIGIGSYAFKGMTQLTRVTIPDTVLTIDAAAFDGCLGLTNVLIPNSVTRISMWAFRRCLALQNITIPKSVTSLGNGAFMDCNSMIAYTVDPLNTNYYSLDGVVFNRNIQMLAVYPAGREGSYNVPEGITRIGPYAFYNCAGLTNISIPDGVTAIFGYTFMGCTGLTDLVLPDSLTKIPSYSFTGCTGLRHMAVSSNVTEMGLYAFQGCSSLTNFVVPNGVTIISDYLFADCTNLARVTLPDRLTSINAFAFIRCASLGEVVIPNGVPAINLNTFSGCVSLTNVVIADSVTNIDTLAFASCSNLAHITLPDSITSLGLGAFYGCGLTNVILPSNASRIRALTFHGCSQLVSATIPSGITRIGDNAFSGCANLTHINIPESVTNLGRATFRGDLALTRVTVPDGVSSLDDDIFSGCSGLTNVVLPDHINSMGIRSFYGCASLTHITLPNSVTNIGNYAFQACASLTEVTIPARVAAIGKGAFADCIKLQSINVDPLNSSYASQDGVLLDKNEVLLAYPAGRKGECIIPSQVTRLEDYSFHGCVYLSEVTVPGSVTHIGKYTFEDCIDLAGITLPDSVTYMGYNAFHNCSQLTQINLPHHLATLGEGAFSDCIHLTNITIPYSVTQIKGAAFFNCSNLASVYFDGQAPIPGIPNVFGGAYPLTVYYRPGTTGWGETFAGRPTVAWGQQLSYALWADLVGLRNQFPNADGEMDDPDHDGLNNLQEMQAGTDPSNPTSRLVFEGLVRPSDLIDADKTPIEPDQLAWYIQTIPGRQYQVQSVNVMGESWQFVTNIAATTSQKRIVLDKSQTQEFYRVVLVP